MIRILSIDSPNHEPTTAHEQYNVVVEVDATPHFLEYSCKFYELDGLDVQSVTWKPEDSVLSNRNEVSLAAAMAINDKWNTTGQNLSSFQGLPTDLCA